MHAHGTWIMLSPQMPASAGVAVQNVRVTQPASRVVTPVVRVLHKER